MKRNCKTTLAAGVLFSSALLPAAAQNAAPAAPTTKILAVGTIVGGADMKLAMSTLPEEVRATVSMYLGGKIDQWYSLQGRPGVVFILNATDTTSAKSLLEGLPLGQAHLMTFELTPLAPLNPLRQLLAPQPRQ